MPRKTREQSLEVREAILDAAERVIAKYGVEKTTMSRVAHAAGATRGAIYWHFRDKSALYEAVVERVTAPPDTASRTGAGRDAATPVDELRAFLYDVLRRIICEPCTWHLMGARRVQPMVKWMRRVGGLLSRAKQQGLIASALDTEALSIGLWIMIDGLVRTWMLDRTGFDLLRQGESLIEPFLTGMASVAWPASAVAA